MVFREFEQGYPVFSFGRIFQSPASQRRAVAFFICALTSLVYAAVYLAATAPFEHVNAVSSTPQAIQTSPPLQQDAELPNPTPPPAPAPSTNRTASARAVAAPTQSCTPARVSAPVPLNLASKTAGMHDVLTPVHYYQIYGTSAEQLRGQIKKCGNGGFAGETIYSLSNQYDLTNLNGICTISNVKVGLHTVVVLPSWQPSTTSPLSSQWQSFIANLTTHENGHVNINRQHAANLHTSLQSYPSGDCASVRAGIKSLVATHTAALESANNNYDAHTNHGATQGAITP